MTPDIKLLLVVPKTIDIIEVMTNHFNFMYGIFLLATLSSFSSWGTTSAKNPIVFSGKPIPYSVGGTTLNIYPEASVTLPTGEIAQLKLSGKGTRQKFMAIVKVNAYVALHYLDNPSLLNSAQPVESLTPSRTRLMVLQMIQNVTPEDIRAEFDDALDVNHVDLYSPEISALREQTTYYLDAGQSVYITGFTTNSDNKEHIMVYCDQKSIHEKGSTLVTDIWRVWLGIPVDPEMANLKKALLNSQTVQ